MSFALLFRCLIGGAAGGQRGRAGFGRPLTAVSLYRSAAARTRALLLLSHSLPPRRSHRPPAIVLRLRTQLALARVRLPRVTKTQIQ